jgi:hypothetical protein
MASNDATDPQFSLPNDASPEHDLTLPKVSHKLVSWHSVLGWPKQFDHDRYYVPEYGNNPLIDSFLATINGSSADLWIFQMTIAEEHGGSKKGYPLVHDIIRTLKDQLKSQGPGF